jgi:2-iminobutanoate/2-iminopropanoate deaminase
MTKPVGPYTPIVRAGDWLIVSGQLGQVDGVLAATFEGQVRQAIVNLRGLLESEGSGLGELAKTTVFLTDMAGQFPIMNGFYVEEFGEARPARSTIEVAGLPMGGLMEIEGWAYSPRG